MRYEHELDAKDHLAREDERDNASVEYISNIMEMLHLSAAEAMNALKILASKQEPSLAVLKN